MDLTLTARRGSAIFASPAAGALPTLTYPSASHTAGVEDGAEVHDGCTATDPTDSDTDDTDDTEDNCQGDDDVPEGGGDGFVVHYVVR